MPTRARALRPRLIAAVAAATLLASGCASAPSRSDAGTDSSRTAAPRGRMEELFVGRFPGVQVFQSPAGGISLRIRGSGTVNNDGEPLYVVDGFPIQTGAGGLLFINPGDIEKIEVLKDIGSTAAWGVQGANGVVLITTRRRQ